LARVTFEVDTETFPGILRLVLSGPVSVADRAQALQAVLAWLPQHSPRRILVDFLNGWPAPSDPQDAARHAENLAREYTTLGGARIAYLSRPEHRTPTPIELQAAARGYFYQRFTDLDAALRWLR